MEKTTIQISIKLKEKLEQLGKKNDTYEEIINKLIENQKQPRGKSK